MLLIIRINLEKYVPFLGFSTVICKIKEFIISFWRFQENTPYFVHHHCES